eukprot:6013863-Prymnesium_polylepis.1
MTVSGDESEPGSEAAEHDQDGAPRVSGSEQFIETSDIGPRLARLWHRFDVDNLQPLFGGGAAARAGGSGPVRVVPQTSTAGSGGGGVNGSGVKESPPLPTSRILADSPMGGYDMRPLEKPAPPRAQPPTAAAAVLASAEAEMAQLPPEEGQPDTPSSERL